MPYRNKHLSNYSEQVKAGVPIGELTDWSKIPDEIVPQKHKNSSPKTAMQARKNKRGFYPEETRVEAVALYAALGNASEVCKILGISVPLFYQWRQTEWWHEMTNRVRDEKNDELDAKFTKVVDKAIAEINDRLENGEYVYNPRTSEVVRVKPKMRDVALVMTTNLDKRQLLRGEPTSRTEKISQSDRLSKLAEEFAKFAGAKTIEVEDANS